MCFQTTLSLSLSLSQRRGGAQLMMIISFCFCFVFFAHPINNLRSKLEFCVQSRVWHKYSLSLSQLIRYLKYQQLDWVIDFISDKAICDAAVLHGTQQGLLRDPPLAHSQQEHLLSDHKSTQPHLYPAVPRLWVPGGRQDKGKKALGFWWAQESSNCGWKECLFLGERERERERKKEKGSFSLFGSGRKYLCGTTDWGSDMSQHYPRTVVGNFMIWKKERKKEILSQKSSLMGASESCLLQQTIRARRGRGGGVKNVGWYASFKSNLSNFLSNPEAFSFCMISLFGVWGWGGVELL